MFTFLEVSFYFAITMTRITTRLYAGNDYESANLIDQVYAYGANTARTFAKTRKVRNHTREMHYRRETAETEVRKRKRDGERNNYLGTRHFMLSHSSYTYPSSFFLVVMKVARCLDISKYIRVSPRVQPSSRTMHFLKDCACTLTIVSKISSRRVLHVTFISMKNGCKSVFCYVLNIVTR